MQSFTVTATELKHQTPLQNADNLKETYVLKGEPVEKTCGIFGCTKVHSPKPQEEYSRAGKCPYHKKLCTCTFGDSGHVMGKEISPSKPDREKIEELKVGLGVTTFEIKVWVCDNTVFCVV